MDLSELEFLYKNPLASLLNRFNKELKNVFENKLIEYQASEFKRNYFTKSFLHRNEPVELDKFYTTLRLKKKTADYGSISEISTKSITELFKEERYLYIIGSAGSGKSTLLKYLFVNSIKEKFKIPIKIELRHLNDSKLSFRKTVEKLIFEDENILVGKDLIERGLDSGNFVFFIDGLDEVSSKKKEKVLNEIDFFSKKYNSNFFIVTSRPHSVEITPALYTECILLELSYSEVISFTQKQLYNNPILAEKIILVLESITEREEYDSFLVNPLLLSMFILTYQNYAEIPHLKSTFYYQVFETLYRTHDAWSKTAFVREKQSGLSKSNFETVLEIMSYVSFFQQKFDLNPIYLNKLLNRIKETKSTLTFNNDYLIEDLTTAIGILVKEGLVFKYPHRSLQEFFAASFISKVSDPKLKENIYKKITKTNTKYGNNVSNLLEILIELDYIHFFEYYGLNELDRLINISKQIENPLKSLSRIVSNIKFSVFMNLKNKVKLLEIQIFSGDDENMSLKYFYEVGKVLKQYKIEIEQNIIDNIKSENNIVDLV